MEAASGELGPRGRPLTDRPRRRSPEVVSGVLALCKPLVSVVLPCLNEAGSVRVAVTQALEGLASMGLPGEVVVADNGSSDGSADLARAAGARVVEAPVRGYGAALSAGFQAARGEICVMADADATYPLDRLSELVEPIIADTADMVIGSRWSGMTMTTMPLLHRFIGTPVITWLVRRAGGPSGISDSQSGFRAFPRQRLLGLGLSTTGMEFASEMLIVAGRAGWRTKEVATGYRERIGQSKLDTFRDGWRHLVTILLLAPNLAATVPGVVLSLAGGILLCWSLVDPAIVRPGSPTWLASFFGPAGLVVGSQAILVGLLLAALSPFAPRAPTSDVKKLLRSYAAGGAWAVAAGIVLCLALVVAWAVGLPPPVRALQIEVVALVLVLGGTNALGIALIGRLLLEGSSRFHGSPIPLSPVVKDTDATPSPPPNDWADDRCASL